MTFFQIMAVAVLGIIAIIITRRMDGEIAVLLVIGVGVILLVLAAQYIVDVVKVLEKVFEKTNVEIEYFFIIIKALIIAYLTEFISQFALDSGESSIASKVQLVGKLAILYLSMPVILSILGMIQELI